MSCKDKGNFKCYLLINIICFCLFKELESGNGGIGINGKSGKVITIGTGEITGGKYISFPKPSLEGNYCN